MEVNDLRPVAESGRVTSYKYDMLGRRVRKLIYENGEVSETICYCYDGDQVIEEYDGAGTFQRKFVYGAGIDEPVAMRWSGKWYYYHYDGLGSVVALSDSSGQIEEECSYDVFGEPSCISGVGNPYKFTGQRYDAETGLYYYRARYYKPEIGRFLQPDPIHYLEGMNLYTYVTNNPLNWTDPWGLRKLTPKEEIEHLRNNARKVIEDEIKRKGFPWYKACNEYEDMMTRNKHRIETQDGRYGIRHKYIHRGWETRYYWTSWRHAVVEVYNRNDPNEVVDVLNPWRPGLWPFPNYDPLFGDPPDPESLGPWI